MSLSYESCIQLFKKGILNQRIASAYLFSGSDASLLLNVGMALSRELLEGDPLKHPDFYFIRPQTKLKRISVQQIKEVCQQLYLKAYKESRKVCLILEAESMCLGGGEAANAFLKTLEEPPSHTTILLTSTRPLSIFPTILSRCIRVSVYSSPFEISTEDQELLAEVQKWMQIDNGEPIAGFKKMALLNEFIQKTKAELEKENEEQPLEETQTVIHIKIMDKRERFLRLLEQAYWQKIQEELKKESPKKSFWRYVEAIRTIEQLHQDFRHAVDESLAIEAAFLPKTF
ncbi:DNA replication protein [Candidatus Methylacidiphilum fumarolicum]|uniref:ATPase involved in DNA replication HolB n=2 Tax=Candidatus Methylacidiphilum fumarolicum TaxID=591154 RepID=I0JZL4_METFB|nr:DNA replication protein [Candidatus Methylacidiphilum fumarolicum]MBW6415460.1 DNA replication protein [Candidatus Methylacidiphilum fumarolicum]TFE69002.1 DNA replication protein [Candidatus Methylacidiphilum fumarolicum]TFE74057.1 DNA replication protein [Candidatus Methylacidiphilum fumarolicum]TFE74168.1 DNA replication protein [Candidatus Methylacidiphilum fumarolicum]TFE74917.1 DNA replication protein [Candidatus Methylacidiphilum fumarolicum]